MSWMASTSLVRKSSGKLVEINSPVEIVEEVGYPGEWVTVAGKENESRPKSFQLRIKRDRPLFETRRDAYQYQKDRGEWIAPPAPG